MEEQEKRPGMQAKRTLRLESIQERAGQHGPCSNNQNPRFLCSSRKYPLNRQRTNSDHLDNDTRKRCSADGEPASLRIRKLILPFCFHKEPLAVIRIPAEQIGFPLESLFNDVGFTHRGTEPFKRVIP